MSDIIKHNPIGATQVYEPQPVAWQKEEWLDVRRLWFVIWRRRWQILGITFCVLVPAAIMTFLATPVYRSTVTLQMDPKPVEIVPYSEVAESYGSSPNEFELYMRTQDEVLKSSTLFERVARRLKEEGNDVERNLGSRFEVERVPRTQLVKISYIAPEPEFAAAAVNTLAEEFISLQFETKYETTEKAVEFLESELGELRVKVEAAEKELIEYMRDHNMLNIDNQEENVILKRFGNLSQKLVDVEARFISKSATYEGLQGASAANFPEGLKTPVIQNLEVSLLQLEQELGTLLSQFDENWPEVIKRRQQISLVKEQLPKEKQATIDQVKEQVHLDYQTAQKEYQMLSAALAQQEKLVNHLNNAGIQYNVLKREVDTNKQLYEGLLQRLKQSTVNPGLEFGNIHILDRGRPSYSVYRPRKARDLSLALILGLSLGLTAALFLEYLDNRVKTPEDSEHFGLPSLGLIPVIEGLNGATKSLNGMQISVANPSTSDSKKDHPFLREWRVQESYRALSVSILLSNPDKPSKKILFTSALPREGKTTTVAYLGVTLAETGARTILIDADLRKPALAERFGVKNSVGVSGFLSGHPDSTNLSDIVQKTSIDNLYVLPSGPRPENAFALMDSSRFSRALDRLAAEFKYLLIDTPPLLTVADASLLAAKMDGVVMVIEAGKTPKEIVQKAQTLLLRSGAKLLGSVINFVDLSRQEYSSYNRYYYQDYYTDSSAADSTAVVSDS